MTSASVVRMAIPSDEESLMELCRMVHAENALMDMDEGKVRNVIQCALYPKRKGNNIVSMVPVIGDIGKIEAACFLIVSQMWYSPKWHLEEVFNFVRPEHRRSTHAKKMIEYIKKCSIEAAMPLIVGIISNKDTQRKCDFYDRMLPKVGHYYLFNGVTGEATV